MEIRPLSDANDATFEAMISFESPHIGISDIGEPEGPNYRINALLYHAGREKPEQVVLVVPVPLHSGLTMWRASVYLADFKRKLLNILGPPDTSGEVTKIFETVVPQSLQFSDDFAVTGNSVDIDASGLVDNFDSDLFNYSSPDITLSLGNGLEVSGGLAVKTALPISVDASGVTMATGDFYSSICYTGDFENGGQQAGKVNVKLGHGLEHTASGIQSHIKAPLYFDDSDDYKLTVKLKDPQEYLKTDGEGRLYYDASYAQSNLYVFGLGLTQTGNTVDVGVSSPIQRDADGIWIQQSTSATNPIKCDKGGSITLLWDDETLGVQSAGSGEYELYVVDSGPACDVPFRASPDRELVW